jgi:hypothetical protein
MAPVKKSKSAKNSESINSRLQLVCKSGKVCFGLVNGVVREEEEGWFEELCWGIDGDAGYA